MTAKSVVTGLAQLLAKAALTGFEFCAEDVKQMLTETGRWAPKCS